MPRRAGNPGRRIGNTVIGNTVIGNTVIGNTVIGNTVVPAGGVGTVVYRPSSVPELGSRRTPPSVAAATGTLKNQTLKPKERN